MEPAAAQVLLSAHSSAIVHLSRPNKGPGSSMVQPPHQGGMLPTQAWQLSFLTPSKDMAKFFVLLKILFPSFPMCYWVRGKKKKEISVSPTGLVHSLQKQ